MFASHFWGLPRMHKLSVQEVGVQGYPWYANEFEASLDYPFSEQTNNGRRGSLMPSATQRAEM